MAGTFVDVLNVGHNSALTQDVLYGLDGNDQLLSSEPTLYAEGGRGNDFIGILNNPTGTVEIYGGQGADTAFGRGGALDKLYGGEGDDWLVGTTATINPNGTVTALEASGVDYMEGGAGSDGLYGFDGNDELYGGGGNDKGTIQVPDVNTFQNNTLHPVKAGLFAGDGNDEVHGGGGDDDIHGGNGNDMLWGDGGADQFFFDTALNADEQRRQDSGLLPRRRRHDRACRRDLRGDRAEPRQEGVRVRQEGQGRQRLRRLQPEEGHHRLRRRRQGRREGNRLRDGREGPKARPHRLRHRHLRRVGPAPW